MKLITQTLLIVVCIAGGLYIALMMREITGYMSAMSSHTVSMSQTMDSMSADIKSMTQQINGMHGGISKIDKHISMMSKDTKSMALQFSGMEGETNGIPGLTGLEHHIAKLNADMSSIQSVMSADLRSMRQGVDSMSYDVRYMRDSLMQMSTDIHRGSEAFSSPQGYFQNMFDYGR